MYYFTEYQNGMERYTDELISDFSNPVFQNGFKQYLSELDVKVENWDDLFRQINDDKDNLAFVRVNENKDIIGFILFQPIAFKSCFFEETYGFIREFWVAPKYRNKRHGSELLKITEDYLCRQGIFSSILTTDTAVNFYLKNGYVKAPGCKAKNEIDVFVKRLKCG